MQKRWTLKEQGDAALVKTLSKELNINLVLANLLVQRGITNYDEAKLFFRPELAHLHDPFLMKDMDKAVDRIVKAIHTQEKILVYGDYDVDGTTAVALVYSFLKSITNRQSPITNLNFYLPDRYKEGYGISFASIDWAKERGYSLIIALDCGIKANEKIDYAAQDGIDFIICDHHLPGEQLPKAVAVLDPKRADCNYPYKELSGCGIGFKLVQAFALQHSIDFSELERYLDLVALSIASDIVPITGENRILAFYGLKQLNENPRPGIKAILNLAGVKKNMTISDAVFIVGPRINAAGRIEDAKHAVELLLSDNAEHALSAGKNINILNTERKELDLSITEHALQLIQEDEFFKKKKTTVLFHPEWNKGVVGIVASRLIDYYYRPTILLTQSNGKATGSARSVKDFDIYNAIEACADLLEQFGGHRFAAGLTLKTENIAAFQKRFEEVVAASIEDRMLVPEIEIDAEIDLKDISFSFYSILKQFAPFGPGNMSPVFKTEGVHDNGLGRVVGENHLKLSLKQDTEKEDGVKVVNAIAFQQADKFALITKKLPFSICYSIEENEWNGKTSLQLNVKDVK